ncbi:MAG: hypothetical protein V3U96_04330 [Paracoccaceae bacterium]
MIPTKARYLKNFWISWATPHVDYNPGEARGLSRGDVVIGINKKVQAFNPLTEFISARLRREKRLLSPEVTHARVHISNVESLYFAFYPNGKNEPYGLYSTYWMNPLDLLDLPDDGQSIGDLGIKIVEGFVEDMSIYKYAVGGFPIEVFESAIADFRANEMKVSYRPVIREIVGSSVKSVFTVYASPNETAIWVAFKKGRKEFFSKQIASHRAGLAGHALTFVYVTICEDALEIHGAMLPSSEVQRIEFTELPSQLVDILSSEVSRG